MVQFRHVSASEHPDLFWGIRGGGGNFGVVTSFAYQLHAVGPMVLAGVLFYPFAKAKEYLRFYGDFSRQSPDELNTIGGLGTSHDGAKVGVMAVCYSGPLGEGSRSCGQSDHHPWLTTSSPCPTPRPSRSWPPWPPLAATTTSSPISSRISALALSTPW